MKCIKELGILKLDYSIFIRKEYVLFVFVTDIIGVWGFLLPFSFKGVLEWIRAPIFRLQFYAGNSYRLNNSIENLNKIQFFDKGTKIDFFFKNFTFESNC